MLAADEVAIITNRKPFTLTILCTFLMTKMQLPKIRNGVFVSCDNDCIHMYGKSVLSMSMTYQKSKEGRGEGVLPTMAYMGRVAQNGVPFPGFKYMKGYRGLTC